MVLDSRDLQDNSCGNVPKEIPINAPNSPHLANLRPQTNNPYAHMSARLDHHIRIICKLWRRGISIVLDLVRDQLAACQLDWFCRALLCEENAIRGRRRKDGVAQPGRRSRGG